MWIIVGFKTKPVRSSVAYAIVFPRPGPKSHMRSCISSPITRTPVTRLKELVTPFAVAVPYLIPPTAPPTALNRAVAITFREVDTSHRLLFPIGFM
jgi:hypothetical protein